MTQERGFFVSPADVSAIRLRCATCGAATTIPIQKLSDERRIGLDVSRACPYCGIPSGINADTREFAELTDFSVLLGKIGETLEGRNLELSFQVECGEREAG